MTKVIKRDGTIVDYNLEKIAIAISGAFDEIDTIFNDTKVLDEIEQEVLAKDEISVEEIQDIVEEKLWKHNCIEQARLYMRYRYNHELKRQIRNDQELLGMLGGENEYWATENSNKNAV